MSIPSFLFALLSPSIATVSVFAHRAGAWPNARSFWLTLPSAPFPGETSPNVLVHTPPSFNPRHTFDVVVYYRGWGSCLRAVASDVPAACHEGGPLHARSAIPAQVDQVARETRDPQLVLVIPELKFEANTGDVGQFAVANSLRRLLTDALAPVGGIGHLRRLYLVAHSGGYTGVAAGIHRGGLNVDGVALLDSFLGESETFRNWLEDTPGHLYSVSTGGSTRSNSVALSTREPGRVTLVASSVEHNHVPERYFAEGLRSIR